MCGIPEILYLESVLRYSQDNKNSAVSRRKADSHNCKEGKQCHPAAWRSLPLYRVRVLSAPWHETFLNYLIFIMQFLSSFVTDATFWMLAYFRNAITLSILQGTELL